MLRRFTQAERLFSQGQILVTQQQYDAAVEVLRRALSLRPQAVGIALHLALALAETGQIATAMDTLHTAMTWQPDHAVLPLFLGQLCVDATDYAQARHWCAHSLALTPHNPYALGLQALVDMALGHVSQGYACLKHTAPLPISPAERLALRLGKSHPPALIHLPNTALNSRLLLYTESYLLRQETPIRPLSQQLLACSPPMLASRCLTLIDSLCTRSVMGLQRLALHVRFPGQPAAQAPQRRRIAAEEAYYLGDSATARTLYTELLPHLPDPHTARQRLCEVCYEQGDFAAALEALRPLVRDETALDAWQAGLLGELLAVAGRYAEAAKALQQAAQQGLQDFKLFYYLGLCQVHQGAHPQARRYFAQAVQLLNPGITALRLDEMHRVYTYAASPPQPYPAE